jgi:hypothetical protein
MPATSTDSKNSSEACSVVLGTAIEAMCTAEVALGKADETTKKTWTGERGNCPSPPQCSWASSFRFETLWEIVDWVGMKIKADKQDRFNATRDITGLCVSGFDEYAGAADTVVWENVFII